jgi:hypothetical protein
MPDLLSSWDTWIAWVRENAEEWLMLPPLADLDKAEFGYCT